MSNIGLVFKYAAKDVYQQKVRAFLGIMGVLVSVMLLAIVLFLSDSISVSFVNYISIDAGNQDMVIEVRHYNGEPEDRSTYFLYEPIEDQIEGVSNEIKNYIPRMEVNGKVNISEAYDDPALTNIRENVLVSGIDISRENEIGFGTFEDPESDQPLDVEKLDLYHCLIHTNLINTIKYSEDETFNITLSLTHGNVSYTKNVEFTVDEIVDYNLKYPGAYRGMNLIVVDIETLYDIFGKSEFEGRCSKLIMTFENADDIYDSRDVDGSERKVKDIAAGIQKELGLNEWSIDLPKLELLGYSEFLTMGITIIFVFVSIIAMLIAGILINGILKTSVEERIREFGIFRTLGAYKRFNLWVVLVQGFILSGVGTAAGIVTAWVVTQFGAVPLANEYLLSNFMGGEGIAFAMNPMSIVIAMAMGLSVGLVVSISPALKVMSLQLIESIHPYRHEDSLYHLQKKASVNYKLVIVGIILAVNGGFIYFVIPRLLISMNITLMAGTLIAVLLVFLIGLTLAGLGLMPIVLRMAIFLARPLAKRLIHVIKIFVFRYQRRNQSTIIIFALSFSFVMFTSTLIQTQSAQTSTMTKLRYGSDILMETTGWVTEEQYFGNDGGGFGGGGGMGFFDLSSGGTNIEDYSSYADGSISLQAEETIDSNRIITTEFEEIIMGYDGVEKVSSVIASPFHLTQVYSLNNKEFDAEIGDYAGLSGSGITLLGIDEEYPSTVDTEFMVFTQGDRDTAFAKIYNTTQYNCIISEAIAISMNLELGDKVRINIQRGDETENYPFTIVGMASSMPGFSFQFSGTQFGASNGGVMISQELYIEILDIPEPAWLDKIFIKLQNDRVGEAASIIAQIDDDYQNDYDYELYNLARRIANQQEAFAIVDALFTLVLMATVVICLFGLLSSSYSTIIERKKEIGIIRTLGLKGKEVNRMFILEAFIIMLSSGFVGTLVGGATGYLLASTLNLFTDMPFQPAFPWLNLLIVYGVSSAFILIGMKILLRKSRKQKIVEIYRETQ